MANFRFGLGTNGMEARGALNVNVPSSPAAKSGSPPASANWSLGGGGGAGPGLELRAGVGVASPSLTGQGQVNPNGIRSRTMSPQNRYTPASIVSGGRISQSPSYQEVWGRPSGPQPGADPTYVNLMGGGGVSPREGDYGQPRAPGSLMQSTLSYQGDGAVAIPVPSVARTKTMSPSMLSGDQANGVAVIDLPDVIRMLSHTNAGVQENAVAYLQHLTYKNPNVKERTRTLNGLPALINLLNSDVLNIQRNTASVLLNMTAGSNSLIKMEFTSQNGVRAVVALLERTQDSSIIEPITGVLWNLSSFKDARRYVLLEAVVPIVNAIVLPHAGIERSNEQNQEWVSVAPANYATVVLQNATGIIRNVSSEDNVEVRQRLRDCPGLVASFQHLVRCATLQGDLDGKVVENCVCTLRNLSYALQEVMDPGYLVRRDVQAKLKETKKPAKFSLICTSSKANSSKPDNDARPVLQPHPANFGEELLLWDPSVVELFLPVLRDSSNSETLEAAAGAIQNLTACDWVPSANIRTEIRQQKVLPVLVELLQINVDRVVCAAATALRNLAVDQRNRDLIGKYSMEQLVLLLPPSSASPGQPDERRSLDAISAVLACIYAVLGCNVDVAATFLERGGVTKCQDIFKHPELYQDERNSVPDKGKVPRFAGQVLKLMWSFDALQPKYAEAGWSAEDFNSTKKGPAAGGVLCASGSACKAGRGKGRANGGPFARSQPTVAVISAGPDLSASANMEVPGSPDPRSNSRLSYQVGLGYTTGSVNLEFGDRHQLQPRGSTDLHGYGGGVDNPALELYSPIYPNGGVPAVSATGGIEGHMSPPSINYQASTGQSLDRVGLHLNQQGPPSQAGSRGGARMAGSPPPLALGVSARPPSGQFRLGLMSPTQQARGDGSVAGTLRSGMASPPPPPLPPHPSSPTFGMNFTGQARQATLSPRPESPQYAHVWPQSPNNKKPPPPYAAGAIASPRSQASAGSASASVNVRGNLGMTGGIGAGFRVSGPGLAVEGGALADSWV